MWSSYCGKAVWVSTSAIPSVAKCVPSITPIGQWHHVEHGPTCTYKQTDNQYTYCVYRGTNLSRFNVYKRGPSRLSVCVGGIFPTGSPKSPTIPPPTTQSTCRPSPTQRPSPTRRRLVSPYPSSQHSACSLPYKFSSSLAARMAALPARFGIQAPTQTH